MARILQLKHGDFWLVVRKARRGKFTLRKRFTKATLYQTIVIWKMSRAMILARNQTQVVPHNHKTN